ncbi:MAG TPA: PDC sensor domain-containing protein, partial [Lachnospiraceae bacterium]|nr:PDC sensor domain-containing protein [Lachnospiraceae bacterium]
MLQLANTSVLYKQLHKKTVYTTEALALSISTYVSSYIESVYNESLLIFRKRDVLSGNKEGQMILEDAVSQFSGLSLIYVQDLDGMQTIRSNGKLANRSDRWWYLKMMEDPSDFVSDAYLSVYNNELVTSIFLPMYDEQDKMIGIYGADLTLNPVRNAIGQYWDKDISYIIMDSKGTVLAGSDYEQQEFINYMDQTKQTIVLNENGEFSLDDNGQILTTTESIALSDSMQKIIRNALD